MALFQKLSIKDKKQMASDFGNKNSKDLTFSHIISPLTQTFNTQKEKNDDAIDKYNLNCYLLEAASLCCRSAVMYINNDADGIAKLELPPYEISDKLNKLEARIAGTIFDSAREEKLFTELFAKLMIVKNPTNPAHKDIFCDEMETRKFINNFQSWCLFIGGTKSIACMNYAGDFGCKFNLATVIYNVLCTDDFNFSFSHPFCKEVSSFYEKIQPKLEK